MRIACLQDHWRQRRRHSNWSKRPKRFCSHSDARRANRELLRQNPPNSDVPTNSIDDRQHHHFGMNLPCFIRSASPRILRLALALVRSTNPHCSAIDWIWAELIGCGNVAAPAQLEISHVQYQRPRPYQPPPSSRTRITMMRSVAVSMYASSECCIAQPGILAFGQRLAVVRFQWKASNPPR